MFLQTFQLIKVYCPKTINLDQNQELCFPKERVPEMYLK